MEAVRVFAYGSVVSTYILIMIGGYVSSSGSGLACPDWPTCNGQIVPPLVGQVLVEYTHRLFALVVAIFVFGATLLVWSRLREKRNLVILSTVTSALLVTQIVLGMVTVNSRLNPLVSTAHLALASAVFGFLVTSAVVIRNLDLSKPHLAAV